MKPLCLILLTSVLLGCGGGQLTAPSSVITPPVTVPAPAPEPAPPPPTPPPPSPPPPVTLPASYKFTVLPPLPTASAAQAQAINDSGVVMGWSNTGEGVSGIEATEWVNAQPIDVGPGYGMAINHSGDWAGYIHGSLDAATFDGEQIGTLPGFDSSQALGIDDDGTVVGYSYDFLNASHEQAFSWTLAGGMKPLDGMLIALAIKNGITTGTLIGNDVGTSKNNRNTDLNIGGEGTAVSSDGRVAGFITSQISGFVWVGNGDIFVLQQQSVLSGINNQGIAVGQIGAVSNPALKPLSPRVVNRVDPSQLQTAAAWDETEGVVDLNTKVQSAWFLTFCSGINDSGAIVGAADNTEETVGFLLEPQ